MEQTIELLKTITNLILALGGISIAFWAAMRFLGKKTIDYFFDRTLAKFNIQFSKLHQDRAEVMKELYKRLTELHSATMVYGSVGYSWAREDETDVEDEFYRLDEQLFSKRFFEAYQETFYYFKPNKIYFDKNLATKIDKTLNLYRGKKNNLKLLNEQFVKGGEGVFELSMLELAEALNELKTILEELEAEFRSILGVD